MVVLPPSMWVPSPTVLQHPPARRVPPHATPRVSEVPRQVLLKYKRVLRDEMGRVQLPPLRHRRQPATGTAMCGEHRSDSSSFL